MNPNSALCYTKLRVLELALKNKFGQFSQDDRTTLFPLTHENLNFIYYVKINGPPRILCSDKRQSSCGHQELGSFFAMAAILGSVSSHGVILCILPVFSPPSLICLELFFRLL